MAPRPHPPCAMEYFEHQILQKTNHLYLSNSIHYHLRLFLKFFTLWQILFIIFFIFYLENFHIWRTNRSRGPHTNCRELKGKKLYGSESFIFIGIWEKRLPIFQNFQSQMNNACMSLSMHASWRFGGVHHSLISTQ